jgi:hypothetical protein
MKYCHTKNDVPKDKHYAVIIFGSYTVPGDERSRTNPGHGYPEHTESTAEYIAFDSRDEWEDFISRCVLETGYFKKDFVAFVVNPVSLSTRVSVTIEGDE